MKKPIRARDRSDTVGTFFTSTICRCGTYMIPQGPQRATGGAERAERRPRLGGPEEYKRSTRSPGGGAWRRSAGMRPDSLRFLEDDLGKRLRPYQQKLEAKRVSAEHVLTGGGSSHSENTNAQKYEYPATTDTLCRSETLN